MKSLQITIGAAAFYAVALAGPDARAIPITGSIGFGATDVTVNGGSLADSTDFTVAAFTTSKSGSYSSVLLLSDVDFNGFVFAGISEATSVTPLWQFTIGATTYSFSATSVSSSYNSITRQWDIGGAGVASITGLSDTVGDWDINLSQTGDSFVFDSSEASSGVPVPEGGTTLAFLGGAIMVVGAFGRKLRT